MKLDSKQMHIASQLFMSAGKAGHPFDLGRFAKDALYASETMAQLSLHAAEKANEALQQLVISAIAQMASVTLPAPAAPPAAADVSTNKPALKAASTTPLSEPSSAPQQYVGRLR